MSMVDDDANVCPGMVADQPTADVGPVQISLILTFCLHHREPITSQVSVSGHIQFPDEVFSIWWYKM
jgi:hypothetical protein